MSKQERKRLTVGNLLDQAHSINHYPKDTVLITSAGAVIRLQFTPAVKGNGIPFPATLEFQTEDDI